MKENYSYKLGENPPRLPNNRMKRKQNNFGIKYENGKNITERAAWIKNM